MLNTLTRPRFPRAKWQGSVYRFEAVRVARTALPVVVQNNHILREREMFRDVLRYGIHHRVQLTFGDGVAVAHCSAHLLPIGEDAHTSLSA